MNLHPYKKNNDQTEGSAMSIEMESVYSVIGAIWTEIPIETKEYILEGYMESHNDMCVLCCDDLTDKGECSNAPCAGPASLSRDELAEHARDAMYDNMHDAGFGESEVTGMLVMFVEAYDLHAHDKVTTYADYKHAEPLKILFGRYWQQLAKNQRQDMIRRFVNAGLWKRVDVAPCVEGVEVHRFYRAVQDDMKLCTMAVEILIGMVGQSVWSITGERMGGAE